MSKSAQLSQEALATLAIEVWRLGQNLAKLPDQPNLVVLKYSAKKLRQTLEDQGCVFLDLSGKIYDAGLALEVIDIEDQDRKTQKENDQTQLFIKETIVPIILFENKLLVSGQVILTKEK
ncbi:MAG: hypothetical protein HY819_00970 [Acidobacteria bacterium]|nr:hypothetical protein [Acidobacteriota bacterium]